MKWRICAAVHAGVYLHAIALCRKRGLLGVSGTYCTAAFRQEKFGAMPSRRFPPPWLVEDNGAGPAHAITLASARGTCGAFGVGCLSDLDVKSLSSAASRLAFASRVSRLGQHSRSYTAAR
jgi:hypothetical protein